MLLLQMRVHVVSLVNYGLLEANQFCLLSTSKWYFSKLLIIDGLYFFFKNVILFHLPPKWYIGLLRWYPRHTVLAVHAT